MTGTRLALVLAGLLIPHGDPAAAVHELHETYSDLAIEGSRIGARVQFFKGDLERAIGATIDVDAVSLTPGPEADALLLRYLDGRLTLVADGDTLRPTLLRGEEVRMTHHAGWQVTLAWSADHAIDEVSVLNTLLFELHDDQRNIMRFVWLPDGKRETVTTEVGMGTAVVAQRSGSS